MSRTSGSRSGATAAMFRELAPLSGQSGEAVEIRTATAVAIADVSKFAPVDELASSPSERVGGTWPPKRSFEWDTIGRGDNTASVCPWYGNRLPSQ